MAGGCGASPVGAAGLGDIGALFPSDDDRWRGADSLELLRDASAQVTAAGYALVNATVCS